MTCVNQTLWMSAIVELEVNVVRKGLVLEYQKCQVHRAVHHRDWDRLLISIRFILFYVKCSNRCCIKWIFKPSKFKCWKTEGIVSDFNIFLWHESEDVNKKSSNFNFTSYAWRCALALLHRLSSPASRICQEGLSERTFQIFPLFPSFSCFSWFSPSFSWFLAIFLLSRGALCPLAPPRPHYIDYSVKLILVDETLCENCFYFTLIISAFPFGKCSP